MESKLQIQRATRMINDSLHGSRTPALSFQQALRIMPATLPRTQTSAQGTQAEASSYTTNDGGKKKKPVSFRQRRPRVDANSPSLSGSSPPSSALPEDRRKNSVKLFLGGSSVSLPLKGGDGKKKRRSGHEQGFALALALSLVLVSLLACDFQTDRAGKRAKIARAFVLWAGNYRFVQWTGMDLMVVWIGFCMLVAVGCS